MPVYRRPMRIPRPLARLLVVIAVAGVCALFVAPRLRSHYSASLASLSMPGSSSPLVRQLLTSAPDESLPTRTPFRITDPRWDDYIIGLKSGIDTAADRVPIQLVTFLQGVKNVWLFGDGDVEVSDLKMVDVVTGAYQHAQEVIRERNGGVLPEYEEPDESFAPPHLRNQLRQRPSLHKREPAHDPAAANRHHSNKKHKSPNNRHNAHFVPGKSKPGSQIDLIPDQASRGWRLDAHKNLPAFREMYHRYPDGKWYVMIDDDTYMFMENLHVFLRGFNHSEPWYLGAPNHFRGCDGVRKLGEGPPFGHGGSGIVLSREALRRLVNQTDECILKYNACWAGDIRVGLCLRDIGIPINVTMSGRRYFNAIAPHWSGHPYYEDPCKRVVSFHHLKPAFMQRLYSIEKFIYNYTFHRTPSMPITPTTHPHHFVAPPKQGRLPSLLPATYQRPPAFAHLPVHIPSPFYAPIHLEDLWHHFVDIDPTVPEVENDSSREGEDFLVYRGVKTWQACRERCVAMADRPCRAWELDKETMCRLKFGVPAPVHKAGWHSGIIKNRFYCAARRL
ncbi:hypothetical protein RI367_004769 [Sorochytrium milnesiophthora]